MAKRGRGLAGVAAQQAAEVTLVGESEVGGQARQVALAAGQSLQRSANAQVHPVARDGVAGRGTAGQGWLPTAQRRRQACLEAQPCAVVPVAMRVVVAFFNGAAVRELLVDLDDDARRLVWSVADGPYTHHNASAQVFSEEDGRTRFVWIADLLPNTLAGRMNDMMEHGSRVIKQTMEA